MDGELESLAVVSVWVTLAICYCHLLVSKIPPGKTRLLAVTPVFYLFAALPFSFSTIHLRCISAFFLAWLSNFKLLLFSFSRGPLSDPRVSFRVFLAAASLPILIKAGGSTPATKDIDTSRDRGGRCIRRRPVLDFAVKALLFAFLLTHCPTRNRYSRSLTITSYSLHIYLELEFVLGLSSLLARLLIGPRCELEPHFSDPYLSTSLQDFWGRRWNLMVTRLLHPAVYVPVRARWGPLAGVMTAFLVSGVMHEAMFYYLTLAAPTGELTLFFLLHGVCTAAEAAAKRALRRRGWRPLPTVVAAPLTFGFVMWTGRLLFFPSIMRGRTEDRLVEECLAMLGVGERVAGTLAGWAEAITFTGRMA